MLLAVKTDLRVPGKVVKVEAARCTVEQVLLVVLWQIAHLHTLTAASTLPYERTS